MDDKVEFVRFGLKRGESRTYALDKDGVMWVNDGPDHWATLDGERQIKKLLTIDEMYKFKQAQPSRR